MAATTKANYTSTVRTLHLQKLLKTAAGKMVLTKFANSKSIKGGSGDAVRVSRLLRPAKQTSEATMGTLITAANAKNLAANHRDFWLENWGDSFGFNEDVSVASWIQDPDNRETIATQMVQSLEYQIGKKMSTQGMRWRIDKDANYQLSGACTTGHATTLISTGLDEGTDDFWKGGYTTITNAAGPNYDICFNVSGFAEASDAATTVIANVGAIGTATPPQSFTTSSKFLITVGTGLIATDILTTDALLDVTGLHELLETEKFAGGIYRAIIHAGQHRDLWTDTTFKNSAIYDKSERFERYQLGRWFDIEFLVASEIYREDADGTENQATGAVHVAPIFGKNSYSIFSFANPGGDGKFSVRFDIVDTPDSGNLRNSAKFISWKGFWAGGVTRATSMIDLMTGATAQGITV